MDWVSILTLLVFTKNLPWLLRGGCLKSEQIVLWHDVINNSLTKHPKKYNTKCTIDQIQGILRKFQPRIRAIAYTRRLGTPFIFDDLRKQDILVIDVIKQLIPKQKAKDFDLVLDPSTSTDAKVLKKLFDKQPNLKPLVQKKRSKTRKRLKKQRRASEGTDWSECTRVWFLVRFHTSE